MFYIDGESVGNEQRGLPRKARVAVVYQPSTLDKSEVFSREVGDKTNNEAEYLALLDALAYISANVADKSTGRVPEEIGLITIFSDSEVIVRQVNGEYKVRETRLEGMNTKARGLMEKIGPIELKHVSREMNYAGLWLEGKWKAGSVHRL